MDPLSVSVASGMRARLESLDMLANNVANAGTAGFKHDQEFYSLFLNAEAAASVGVPATLPVVEKAWTDFNQGILQTTGNPLDVALSGKGFFAVNGPAGPLYTRAGNFQQRPDGTVTSQEGYAVRLEGGAPLQLQGTAPLEVARDGSVKQNGNLLGRLQVAEIADSNLLSKQGATMFRLADSATSPVMAKNIDVQQGKLEQSNVSAAGSAVRLISVMRQFEGLQKALQIGAEMNRKAIEEVARV
ncbi:MAG: flagellar basal-body rod protein FlgF [Bryobacteraceae bacterium]